MRPRPAPHTVAAMEHIHQRIARDRTTEAHQAAASARLLREMRPQTTSRRWTAQRLRHLVADLVGRPTTSSAARTASPIERGGALGS
jgi:hypothetical protein